MDRFDRNTFESVDYLTETVEAPKIKQGGSSSSNILNRFFKAITRDVSLLITRTNILANRSSRIYEALSEQSAAINTTLNTLTTKVNAASGYSMVFASLQTPYLATSTATVNSTFRQATLPELSSTDLLLQTDTYGNKYLSPEIEILYSSKTASSITGLSILDFTPSTDGLFMLKQEQVWLETVQPSQTDVWVRIKAPLQYRGLTPNVLEIWPLPAFSMDLKKVLYRKAGEPENTWTSVDLSYAPLYNGATDQLEEFGPVRLHLDNDPITEVVINLGVSGLGVWGLRRIKIYHKEYDSTADLVLQDPHSRTIKTIILKGKDPSYLSTLPITKVGSTATITLSTTDSSETPVIMGAILDLS